MGGDICPQTGVSHGTRPAFATDLWRTDTSPAGNSGPLSGPLADSRPAAPDHPARLGFRVVELPPGRDWRFDGHSTGIGPLAFHATSSIDYAIVLHGEIRAAPDAAGSRCLRRGRPAGWRPGPARLPCHPARHPQPALVILSITGCFRFVSRLL
jgi:hypothetical protein